MIRFNQVCKRYTGGYEALKNVSIERPNSGSVLVNNQNVGVLKGGALPYLRRNLGIIFQDHKLLFDRSVFDNVLLPLQICGFDHRESSKRVRAALDKVNLLKREKTNPIALSGGEQQRLCIARAIVNRPAILLADEPTGNLDAEYAREIMAIFKSFHQVGVTLLISTHDENILQDTGVRVLALKHGELQPATSEDSTRTASTVSEQA